jgi:hypothetical protein
MLAISNELRVHLAQLMLAARLDNTMQEEVSSTVTRFTHRRFAAAPRERRMI